MCTQADSLTWHRVHIADERVERVRHTMTVEPASQVVYVFGGEDRNRFLQNSCFELRVGEDGDGDFVGSFVPLACGAVPSERFGHAATHHTASATMLVCAGYAGAYQTYWPFYCFLSNCRSRHDYVSLLGAQAT